VPLTPHKEFVLVQSEYYLGAAKAGVMPFDYTKMLATSPANSCSSIMGLATARKARLVF